MESMRDILQAIDDHVDDLDYRYLWDCIEKRAVYQFIEGLIYGIAISDRPEFYDVGNIPGRILQGIEARISSDVPFWNRKLKGLRETAIQEVDQSKLFAIDYFLRLRWYTDLPTDENGFWVQTAKREDFHPFS